MDSGMATISEAIAPATDHKLTPFVVHGWTRLAHTTGREAICLDVPMAKILEIAERGSRVRIQVAADPSEAVQSVPRSYPVVNLQRGESIGCGRALDRIQVAENWVCSNRRAVSILDSLWHEKVQKSPETQFDRCVYSAQGNAQGMSWKQSPRSANSWATGPGSPTPGLPAGLEIFVDAVDHANLATHIKVLSFGEESGQKAEFLLNQVRIPMATGRGINVVTIDLSRQEKVNHFSYDTAGHGKVANEQLTKWLNGLRDGILVLVALQGAGLEALEPESWAALQSCGATPRGDWLPGHGYALVGCKGGFALDEGQGPRAMAAGWIEGLQNLAAQVSQGTWGKNIPKSITDTQRGNKMPALYAGAGKLHNV